MAAARQTGPSSPSAAEDARVSIAAIGDTTAELAEQAKAAEAVGIDCVTYFIPPEQIGEYQARIIEAFGSAK